MHIKQGWKLKRRYLALTPGQWASRYKKKSAGKNKAKRGRDKKGAGQTPRPNLRHERRATFLNPSKKGQGPAGGRNEGGKAHAKDREKLPDQGTANRPTDTPVLAGTAGATKPKRKRPR